MIHVKGLTKTYRQQVVFEDLHIQLKHQKINFIMGKNGSGKTTFMKCLLQLEQYEGEILYNDQPIDQVRHEIQVMYDDTPLYMNLNGYQNIRLLLNVSTDQKKCETLARKYLPHEILKKKVKHYSYGQKKKLSFIFIALTKPTYLFLDEISNGLDYGTMMELKTMIKQWSEDMTIIATGHQFEFYSSIVDELFILKDKSMIQIHDFQEKGEDLGDIYQAYL